MLKLKSLWIIFFFALLLRLVSLGQLPLHLHQDEIMNGYVGRYILQNGVDLYGNRWPILYFDNFGDFPSVVPMYLSGLFTYIFGTTEFAIRFPIAVLGAAAIFPMYFIAKKIFDSNQAGLVAAIFLCILPWHIVLSRATAEAVGGTTLFLCGIVFLFQFLEKKKTIVPMVFSLLFFLSTYFFYHPFRVIVPLLLGAAAVLYVRSPRRGWLIASFVFFFLLTFAISRTPWGLGRFRQTSIFTFNNQTNNRIAQYARDAGDNHALDLKIFNNKLVVYSRELIRQYISYWSPQFLFTDGGRPYRYLVPDQGLVPLSFLAITIIVFGLMLINPSLLTRNEWDRKSLLLILWVIVIAPLSAALTLDEIPNVHRSGVFGVVLVFFFVAVYQRFSAIKWNSKLLHAGFWIVLLLETFYFWHQYQVLSPAAQAPARYDARTELAKKLIELRSSYTNIIVPREIFILYYLFYSNNYSPSLAGKFKTNLYIPQVDNIFVVDNDCTSEEKDLPLTPNTLIVERTWCDRSGRFEPSDALGKNETYRVYKHTPKLIK